MVVSQTRHYLEPFSSFCSSVRGNLGFLAQTVELILSISFAVEAWLILRKPSDTLLMRTCYTEGQNGALDL